MSSGKLDREIIKGVLQGDEFWLRKFHERYRERLLNFILQKTDDPRDAEEIVQDALLSAIYCLPSFLGKSSFWSWLCAIAKHEMADFYRKKKIKTILFSRLPVLEEIASRALGPEMALEEKELKERIFRVFLCLTEGYREILRLKYIEELSVRQVAERFKKSVKAIEMRLRRARLAFIESWDDKEIDPKRTFALNQGDLSFFEECLGLVGPSLSDSEDSSG